MNAELLMNEKTEELQRLKELLMENERTNVELESENEILITNIKYSSDLCKELETDIENLKLKYNENLKNKEQLHHELTTFDPKPHTINEKDSFNSMKNENEDLNNALFSLNSENKNMKIDLEDVKEENERLNFAIFDLEQMIQQFKTDLTELENIIEVKENQITEIEDCCQLLQEKVVLLKKEMMNAKNPAVLNEDKNSLFEEVNVRFKAVKEELESEVNQFQDLQKQYGLKMKERNDISKDNIKLCRMIDIQNTNHWKCLNNFKTLFKSLENDLQFILNQNKHKIENIPTIEHEILAKNQELTNWVEKLKNNFSKEIKQYQNKLKLYSMKDYFVTRELFETNLALESVKKNVA